MNAHAARACASVLAIVLGALAGCASNPASVFPGSPTVTSSQASQGAAPGAASPRSTGPTGSTASAPSGTLADILLPGADIPGGLLPVSGQYMNLGPLREQWCRQVVETFASAPDITDYASVDGVEIQVSECAPYTSTATGEPVNWLRAEGIYGQPYFTDVTDPAIGEGMPAIAEVAPDVSVPDSNSSVQEVIVTWLDGVLIGSVLVVAHQPFPSYASESGAEALAKLEIAQMAAFPQSLLNYCAELRRGAVNARCGTP